MRQFVAGFVLALLAVVPIGLFLLRKKRSTTKKNRNGRLKQVEQLSKLTGELAHEIKNPLSTIKINLKLTAEQLENLSRQQSALSETDKSSDDLGRAVRKIAVIQQETDRLEQILDSFLRYIGKPELQLACHDINQLVSDMIDFYTPQCLTHSITIRQALVQKPLVCRIDADMLKQVILNLFINAQQAMTGGGELMVKTQQQAENAVIRISDTGSGIEPDRLPRIFDAHYSSRPRGTGLGLPTAKKIVQAHNGTLTISSEPGKGTLLTITLPLHSIDKG